jgi:hypothetical protein
MVTHAASGLAVTPAATTRLVPSSMRNSTDSVCGQTLSTVKKSQATIALAWARRNWVQVGPHSSWAGPSLWRRSNDRDRRGADPDGELAKLATGSDATPAGILLASRTISAAIVG